MISPLFNSSITRRVVVSHVQRLGELALDGFGGFRLGTKPSAMTRAATAFGQLATV